MHVQDLKRCSMLYSWNLLNFFFFFYDNKYIYKLYKTGWTEINKEVDLIKSELEVDAMKDESWP